GCGEKTQRQHGRGAPRFNKYKRDAAYEGQDKAAEHNRMRESQRTEFDHRARKAGESEHSKKLAGKIERVTAMRLPIARNVTQREEGTQDSDGKIYQEDAAPSQRAKKQSTNDWSGGNGDATGGRPQADHARAHL